MTLTRTPLKRKTPLKAKTPLKRTPFKRKPIATKNADDEDAVKTKKTTKVTKPRKKKTERQKLIEQLDRIFSIYIRIKDATPHTGLVRCITSGRVMHWKTAQCGHFQSRRHYSCRWLEMNCHPQSMEQNVFEHGNLLVYREKMIEMYGEEAVNKLTVLAHTPCHISEEEMRMSIKYYTALVEKIKEEKGL